MNALLSFWTWFEIGLVAFLGFFVQLVLAAVTLPFDRKRVVVGRCFRLVGVTSSKLTPFWRFGVHGEAPRHSPGRTVVVANHESQADPFLISHLPWEMKWLSKAAFFRYPLLGWMMRMAGDISLVRGERGSAIAAMKECRQRLDNKVSVMIFPEGTRSRDGELKEFKDGAFRLAIDSGVPILPLAVNGAYTALVSGDWRLGVSNAEVRVLPPISTDGLTKDDVDDLKQRTHAAIAAAVAEMRA